MFYFAISRNILDTFYFRSGEEYCCAVICEHGSFYWIVNSRVDENGFDTKRNFMIQISCLTKKYGKWECDKMIYEPENLKNKRTMYKKKDKMIVAIEFFLWAVVLFIYVNIVIPYVKTTIGFFTIIVGGIVTVTAIYFFIAFYLLARRGHRFRKINNAIVREYHENKNGELFLKKLLAIEEKAIDMNEEITWYLNIATAFSVTGKRNESISLLKQLEEVATGKDKECIQNSIKFIQEQIENEG